MLAASPRVLAAQEKAVRSVAYVGTPPAGGSCLVSHEPDQYRWLPRRPPASNLSYRGSGCPIGSDGAFWIVGTDPLGPGLNEGASTPNSLTSPPLAPPPPRCSKPTEVECTIHH